MQTRKIEKKLFKCKLKRSETWPKASTKKQPEKLVARDIFNKSQTNKEKMNR